MRILVVSDSHGDTASLRAALCAQPTAKTVFFLGDGERDLEAVRGAFPERTFVAVSGNCDFSSALPAVELRRLEGCLVSACHGHTFHVKSSLYEYRTWARRTGVQVALFGHTHQPFTQYDDGLYLLNPGSVRGWPGTYGVVDITSAGIVMNVVEIKL